MKKFVKLVKKRLLGEKNGREIGRMFYIVARDVLGIR
tara:strand:+ start:661 stop:771 length:111 start_codon:yes stop_codon:yes gene_type:complete